MSEMTNPPGAGSGTKSRSDREMSEFSTLTAEQRNAVESHWDYLREEHGLTLRMNGDTCFSYIREPKGLFNYDGIALDPLMHSPDGQAPIVTTVCGRLSCNCMYLESDSLDALKFLHWKYWTP